jgi:excisionase family DNA binding protein
MTLERDHRPLAGGLDDDVRHTVSILEAAKFLGISRNSAYVAARNGEIPTVRIGRLFRVPVVSLKRMITPA